MPRDLDINLYRAFISVVETGGMTAAAKKLHLTQAAISLQVKRLETALGCALLMRRNRRMIATAAGERLLGKARAIVALSDDIWREMTDATQSVGELRLGAPTDLVGRYLPPVLKAFSREFPQVAVTLVCHTSPKLIDAWEKGEVDVVIVEEGVGLSPRKEQGERLLADQLVWVGAVGGEAVYKSPLPVSLCNDSSVFRPAMLRALKEARCNFRTLSEVGTIETVSAALRTDLAISALLASTVPQDIEILGAEQGLPELPPFEINLYGAGESAAAHINGVCRLIRQYFAQSFQQN